MASHNELGKIGEKIAAEFLQKKNYKLLHHNWRHKKHEIDLIALDKELLVFVEVKTRSSYRYGFPDESVDAKKEKILIEAAEIFLENSELHLETRFDIISVIKNQKTEKVYHIIDAFRG